MRRRDSSQRIDRVLEREALLMDLTRAVIGVKKSKIDPRRLIVSLAQLQENLCSYRRIPLERVSQPRMLRYLSTNPAFVAQTRMKYVPLAQREEYILAGVARLYSDLSGKDPHPITS